MLVNTPANLFAMSSAATYFTEAALLRLDASGNWQQGRPERYTWVPSNGMASAIAIDQTKTGGLKIVCILFLRFRGGVP